MINIYPCNGDMYSCTEDKYNNIGPRGPCQTVQFGLKSHENHIRLQQKFSNDLKYYQNNTQWIYGLQIFYHSK